MKAGELFIGNDGPWCGRFIFLLADEVLSEDYSFSHKSLRFKRLPCSSPITIVFDALGGTRPFSDTVIAIKMSKVSCHVSPCDLERRLKDV